MVSMMLPTSYKAISGAVNASQSKGPTLVSGGSSHTKGDYVEFHSALPSNVHGVHLAFTPLTGFADLLYDIAVGAEGSEVIVLSNFLQSSISSVGTGIYIPIFLPAGERVAIRVQSTTGADEIEMTVSFFTDAGYLPSFHKVDTYGINTGDSGGTEVDPGGTTNTKGSYSEITSALSNNIKYVILSIGSLADNIRTDAHWLLDLAIGGAGSEVVIVSNLSIVTDGDHDNLVPHYFTLPMALSAGVRVAARAQCDITNSNPRLLDVALYGFR